MPKNCHGGVGQVNSKVVRDLVSFAIAEAARQDEVVGLGPIHLMKYLYLADWAYARTHEGVSLTKIPWRFYHFGPYSDAVENDLGKAANQVTDGPRTFYGSKSGREVKRWELDQSESTEALYLELERSLPFEAVTTIKRAIKEFGNSTYPLLHHVYATPPMRLAAPGEFIDFKAAIQELTTPISEKSDQPAMTIKPSDPGLSTTQKKKQGKALESLKERMEEARIRSVKSQQLLRVESPEDAVFTEGLVWLDGLSGNSQSFTGTFEIDPAIWHSALRRSIQ